MNIRRISILCLAAFLSAATTIIAADGPRLRLQTWVTATHIYWVRPSAPDRVAVSYVNGGASGLDILDSSGQVARRVWPLPAGTHCAAVYPDGRLFLRQEGFDWNPQLPAAIRPDGSAIVLTGDTRWPLMLFGPTAPDGRAFGQTVFGSSNPSWVDGLEAQPDGKIFVWGRLTLADGSSANLIRINLDEILDPGFHSAVSKLVFVRNVRSSPDGTTFVETLDSVASSDRREWVRLNSDGTVRSLVTMTFPQGTFHGAAAILDDGSVVLSVEGGARLRLISADGSSSTRDGIGFWSSFWMISDLIPLASGQLVARQRAACDGGGCYAQDWLRVLPSECSGGQMVTWVPPSPNYGAFPPVPPMLFAENLSSEADYVVEASTDFREWQEARARQERSSDRKSLFLRDSEALDLKLERRFYRVKKLN